MALRRTTVEIDTDELAQAEAVLGTRGIKETVNRALREVNRRAALERAAAYVLAGELHLPDEPTLAAWRDRGHAQACALGAHGIFRQG